MSTEETKTYTRTKWGWGRTEAPQAEVRAQTRFPWPLVYALTAGVPAVFLFYILRLNFTFFTFLVFVVLALLFAMPTMAGVLYVHSRMCVVPSPAKQDVIIWTDDAFKAQWLGKKIPMETLQEAYFAKKVDFKGDLLDDMLYKRYDLADMVFTPEHYRFFLTQFIPELLWHSRKQDTGQVREHYDRGDDFYNWFLGETMMYTSGVFLTEDDSLEQSQINKLNLVFNKIHTKKGDKHLDIGCGWGSTIKHAAGKFGTDSTGITLSVNQTAWANKQIAAAGLAEKARALCMDYRDIPFAKYDKITCLEMSEHVGVIRYPKFCKQVYDMLNDDGMFFLQIAGLRRPWQYEDLVWGLFMGKYVFPGADASCPLAWVVDQVEGAGFEVHTIENVGIHYSATIKRWYDNWQSNKAKVIAAYGEPWWRKWAWFLGWSTIIAEQGSATCWQLVLRKNTRKFDRKSYAIGERATWSI